MLRLQCQRVLLALTLITSVPFLTYAESDQEKISRLEKQLTVLSRHVFQNAPTTAAPVTSTPAPLTDPSQALVGAAQTAAFEQQQRQVVSRLEELEHRVEHLASRLDHLINGSRDKQTLPDAAGAPPVVTPSPAPESNEASANMPAPEETSKSTPVPSEKNATPVPPTAKKTAKKEGSPEEQAAQALAQSALASTLPEGSVQQQYDQARGFLVEGKHKEAEQAFREFLKVHPDHELAANSTYWLGETFFIQQKYDKAMTIFAQGYKAFSQSPKGPDILLKIAMCLEKQAKPQDACLALDQLKQSHKVVSQGVSQMADKVRQRLKCAK